MKKLLLIPALLLGSVAMATEYNYEITPLIGYNIAEGNLHLDDYAIYGGEVQYNGFDYMIKPELSFLFSLADYKSNLAGYVDTADTNVIRLALNGVYEFDKLGPVTPLVKAGIGYENMDGTYSDNTNSAFIDAGVGAKISFTDMIALKLEALYMLKDNDSRYDSNLAILAGLNIAFGEKPQKVAREQESAPVEVATVVKEEPIVEEKPVEPTPVAQEESVVEATTASVAIVDGDDDEDGVLNSMDICLDSPEGAIVNSDGCPEIQTLHVNFKYKSYSVDDVSGKVIQNFADFLNMYPSYSTNIVGHTDNIASAKYNKKLSMNRADAVKNLLIKKGVSSSRVSCEGMGESNPIADNATESGRAQNRRVVAELIKN